MKNKFLLAAIIGAMTLSLYGADAKKACKNACIGCKKCEKTCPNGAITVINNCAVIDYSKCTGCKACASACPTGCLKEVFFPDLEEGIL